MRDQIKLSVVVVVLLLGEGDGCDVGDTECLKKFDEPCDKDDYKCLSKENGGNVVITPGEPVGFNILRSDRVAS